MKYEILFCDIDGTLLNSRRQLSEENIKAVKEGIAKGLKFVLTTGRPYDGVTSIAKKLGIDKDGIFILYNGAVIHKGETPIYSLNLDQNIAKTIVSEGIKRNSTIVIWNSNRLYAHHPCEKIDFYKSISGVEPIYTEDLLSVCDDRVTKILWYDDPISTPVYYSEMTALLQGAAACYQSFESFIEFVNKDCSKSTALKFVADYFNVPVQNTVAVGDSFNDLPMLETAGFSVAMQNADIKIQKVCDYVTLSCDNNGVADLIYRILDK